MKRYSIRSALLTWLLVPLLSLSWIGAAVTYGLAIVFSDRIYDEFLLNSADSVLARIDYEGRKVQVDLPAAAQATLRHNDKDKFYYEISASDGTFLSGDAQIPGPTLTGPLDKPQFYSATISGAPVRVVKLTMPLRDPSRFLIIQCAETLNARHELAKLALIAIMVLQLLSLLCVIFAVYFGVRQGFRRLQSLQEGISKRHAWDLKPLDTDNAPAEVFSLVETINILLSELQNHIDAQHRFVANAAHQLRTPLAGVKTYVDIGLKLADDERVNGIFVHINKGAGRMAHLIRQLLILARSEQSSIAPRVRERIDLNDIASDAAFELANKSVNRNVDLEFEPSSNSAVILGDQTSLLEMTKNLIDNAISYTPPGGKVKIAVEINDEIRLTVEDNGVGIPEKERQRVFERFYRIIDGDTDGSGLGLAIVKEIVDAHKGRVAIESGDAGRGTKVVVTFTAISPTHTELSSDISKETKSAAIRR
jgi:two-component system, OmpR family, sensor histidine kinase TctE